MPALQSTFPSYRAAYSRLPEEHGKTEMDNTKGGKTMIFALAVLLEEEQFTLHQIGELLYGKN